MTAADPASADETYTHPAGAFRLTLPAGWHRIAAIGQTGVPCYVFTPDNGDNLDQVSTGIWVSVAPFPTEDELDKNDAAALAGQSLATEEPGLTEHGASNATIGELSGLMLELSGKHNGSDWRGQLIVARKKESFVLVRFGCPPQQWQQMRLVFERILAGFVAPVARAPHSPPRLHHAQEAAEVADKLAGAVPLIHVQYYQDQEEHAPATKPTEREKKDAGWGSGFIIRDDGYIITNRHVVAAGTDGKFSRTPYCPMEIGWDQSLHLPRVKAEVVGVSRRYDLALLKIVDGSRKWPAVPISDISQARNADRVLVMGWPDPSMLGESDVNHNEGTLTLLHDELGRVNELRHSARTTSGNSGGPLYDLNTGTVIGVHYKGIFSSAHEITEVLYHGTIPMDKVLWEFPQVTAPAADAIAAKMFVRDRQALIAFYFLEQRFGAAVFECKKALAEDPNDGIANAYLYRIYALQSSPDLAEPCLKIAISKPESRVRALIFAARTCYECDNLKGAETAASEAVHLAPNNPDGYIVLGETEIGMGRVEEGETHLQRASQLTRGFSPEVEVFLGWTPLQEWLVKNQINKMPWSFTFPADLAAKANQHLQKSYKLQSSRNWVALADLGFVAGFSGDSDLAAKCMGRVLSVSGDDPDALLCLAYYKCLLCEPKNAYDFANAAMEARETPRGHFILAWAILLNADAANKAGKTQEAQKFLKMALIHEALAAHGAPDAFWAPIAKNIINQFKSAIQQ
jgi:S1-C subfamily serine protease/tetratricopeptide (TPR) repeat protein